MDNSEQLQAPRRSSLNPVEEKPSRDGSSGTNSFFRRKPELRVDAELIVHGGGTRRKAGAS